MAPATSPSVSKKYWIALFLVCGLNLVTAPVLALWAIGFWSDFSLTDNALSTAPSQARSHGGPTTLLEKLRWARGRPAKGTTAEHAFFIGRSGEISVDTSKHTIVVHDGATPGGIPHASQYLANILEYGAVGDGVTDCTKAIQAAIDSGRKVLIPPGTFLITGLVGRRAELHIEGTGPSSCLKMAGAAVVALTLGQEGRGLETVHLRSFRIAGGPENLGGIKLGTKSSYVAFASLENLKVDGFTKVNGYGLSMESVQELHVHNCRLEHNYDNIFRPPTGYCTSTTISGSAGYCAHATHRGINLIGRVVDFTLSSGVVLESNAKEALYSEGVNSNIVMKDCYLEDNCDASGIASIYVSGTPGAFNQSNVYIARNHFHVGRKETRPNLKLDRIMGGLVLHNFNVFGSNGGVETTPETQCHFAHNHSVQNVDMLKVSRSLPGKITFDDYAINEASGFRGGSANFIDGHLRILQGTAPKVAIHTNAGVGATVMVSEGSTDTHGVITFTPGTSPKPGQQFTFTAAIPYRGEPRVVFFPAHNATSATALAVNRPFISPAADGIGWEFNFATALTNIENQYWYYIVLE